MRMRRTQLNAEMVNGSHVFFHVVSLKYFSAYNFPWFSRHDVTYGCRIINYISRCKIFVVVKSAGKKHSVGTMQF